MNKIKNIITKILLSLHKLLNDNYTPETVYETPIIRKCYSKSQKTKNALTDWINSYNPTHFLTVQLPENMKTPNFDISKEHLRKIMAGFEFQLLGKYWNKDHLPFICVSEQGKGDCWHYHILFNSNNFMTKDLDNALSNTANTFKLPLYTFYLDEINDDKDKVYSYCTKEIKVYKNGYFDSSRIIPSNDLFNLSPIKL